MPATWGTSPRPRPAGPRVCGALTGEPRQGHGGGEASGIAERGPKAAGHGDPPGAASAAGSSRRRSARAMSSTRASPARGTNTKPTRSARRFLSTSMRARTAGEMRRSTSTGSPSRASSRAARGRSAGSEMPRALPQRQRRHHAQRDRLAVQQAVGRLGLEGVAQRVAEVQDGPAAGLALVAGDHRRPSSAPPPRSPGPSPPA